MNSTNLKIGQYKILHLLGKGGMATVYLGIHETLGKKVAIKILNDDLARKPNARKRFLSEAKSMANLSHPNIIPVIDLIEEDNNVAFVMEYVEGKTLKEYIEEKGSLSNSEIKILLCQIINALKYVHEKGMVHRDVKPSNFVMSGVNTLKLFDFGIAKNRDASIADYTETQTTQQMGTPMYMSPEQIKSTKNVNSHTDIYSLGVLLWQMVKGVAPYNTSSISAFELQTQIVNEPLELTNTIWDAIIQKATAKLPVDRYTGMDKLLSDVEMVGAKDSNLEKTTLAQNITKTPTVNPNKGGLKGNTVFETIYYVLLCSLIGLIEAIIYQGMEASWIGVVQIILILRILYGFNQYLVQYLDFKKSTFSTYIFMSIVIVLPILLIPAFYAIDNLNGVHQPRTLSSDVIALSIGVLLYGILLIYASFRLFINLFLVKGPGMTYFRIIGVVIFLAMLVLFACVAMKVDLTVEPIRDIDYLFLLIFDGILFMGFWKVYKAFGSVKKIA